MRTVAQEASKKDVRSFWENRPCGSKHAEATRATREFFQQVDTARQRLEPYIADFADFDSTRDLDVLEIGVGLGSDHLRFARAGARLSGVDLTTAAIDLTRKRLELEGLHSALLVADAESLPFDSATFDVVYSWGVLHHTPDTDRAIREALRVLRPGGRACFMLYARYSWVAWALWMRYGLLRGRPTRTLSDVLGDHLESPGTKGFTRRELMTRFGGLENLRIDRALSPADRKVAGPLASLTAHWLGFYLVVRGTARQP